MYKIITDYDQAKTAGLLSNGRFFIHILTGRQLYLPYNFQNRLDLDNLVLYLSTSDEGTSFPDLNTLIKEGIIKEVTIFNEYEVFLWKFCNCNTRHKLTPAKIDEIIADFKKHGFNVTREAIEHNYQAWLIDHKSGYRDEKNGYHLFSPCGCNPLRLSATSLCETCEWQETYSG